MSARISDVSHKGYWWKYIEKHLTCNGFICFLILRATFKKSFTCNVSGFLYSISRRLKISRQWRSVKSDPRRYFNNVVKSCDDNNDNIHDNHVRNMPIWVTYKANRRATKISHVLIYLINDLQLRWYYNILHKRTWS